MFKKKAINIMKARVFSDFEILGGKFMNKNFKSKLVAGLMTTSMIFSSAAAFAPVHAASFSGNPSMTFKKYLRVEKEAKIPTATFGFTITAGKHKDASGDTQEILAGVDVDKVQVGQASFNKDSSVVAAATGVDAKGMQLAESDVTVDFSNVNFPGAGIYRYVISENDPSNTTYFTKDSTSQALDVFVTREDTGLKVDAYTLHNNVEANVKDESSFANLGKNVGFVNDYTSYDLKFAKETTGNQRNPGDEFTYTLDLTGLVPNSTLAVSTNSDDTDTHALTTNSISTGTAGTVTGQIVKLKAGQYFKIIGLNKGAEYTLTETGKGNYELTSVTAKDGAITELSTTTQYDGKKNDNTSIVNTDKSVNDDALNANADITFLNTKDGKVPTGIIFAVAPFAVGAVVLAAFIIVKMRRTAKQ